MLNWEKYELLLKIQQQNVKLFVQSNIRNIKHVQAGIYKIGMRHWNETNILVNWLNIFLNVKCSHVAMIQLIPNMKQLSFSEVTFQISNRCFLISLDNKLPDT